jgi:L-cysteine S-thiosulfotransferase
MSKLTPIAAAVAAASLFLVAGQGTAQQAPAPTQGAAPAKPAAAPEAASVKRPEPLKKRAPEKAAPQTEVLIMDSQGIRMAPASVSAQMLAEYLILESAGFDLSQPTQEGTTGKDRLVQDDIQKLCSLGKGQPLDAKTAQKVSELALASIKYPEGGIKLGDWKKGRELAWSGFGWRTAHNPDDHGKQQPGANCYNCHQLATDRTGGTIGPPLTSYGKLRGNSEEILKYTYGVIYNAHAYFPCTNMPRMGARGVLTEEQIADVMAYLFDPASPVNTSAMSGMSGM